MRKGCINILHDSTYSPSIYYAIIYLSLHRYTELVFRYYIVPSCNVQHVNRDQIEEREREQTTDKLKKEIYIYI